MLSGCRKILTRPRDVGTADQGGEEAIHHLHVHRPLAAREHGVEAIVLVIIGRFSERSIQRCHCRLPTIQPPQHYTRYSSISSPASFFLLSQFGMRPRPDHVSLVTGSRYFTLTSALRTSLAFACALLACTACGAANSTLRLTYAMLLLVMPTSSQPSAPAAFSSSSSSPCGRCRFKSIFRYFHSGMARASKRRRPPARFKGDSWLAGA